MKSFHFLEVLRGRTRAASLFSKTPEEGTFCELQTHHEVPKTHAPAIEPLCDPLPGCRLLLFQSISAAGVPFFLAAADLVRHQRMDDEAQERLLPAGICRPRTLL